MASPTSSETATCGGRALGICEISGAACFRCVDCPEAIGFDLCGECVAAGAAGALGRFGQEHKTDHRLEERPQERTAFHELQVSERATAAGASREASTRKK